MPVRIRLSRGGAKKRPFYRVVVADSRRARDGKYIDQLGTYNPMLKKDNPERIKIDIDKAKDWIAKGAQPSERIKIFLSSPSPFIIILIEFPPDTPSTSIFFKDSCAFFIFSCISFACANKSEKLVIFFLF